MINVNQKFTLQNEDWLTRHTQCGNFAKAAEVLSPHLAKVLTT